MLKDTVLIGDDTDLLVLLKWMSMTWSWHQTQAVVMKEQIEYGLKSGLVTGRGGDTAIFCTGVSRSHVKTIGVVYTKIRKKATLFYT